MATGSEFKSHMKKTWTILWLDAQVNVSEENQNTQRKLAENCNELVVFENTDECEQYIQSIPTKLVILLVSGRLSREIVPAVERCPQISGIIIYCMDKTRHEKWAEDYPKIIGVIVKWEELISQIQAHQTTGEKTVDKPHASTPSTPFPKPKIAKIIKHPLDGYEKIPEFTIEKAVISLIPFVGDVEQMAWIVKQNCQTPEGGLGTNEAASIMLYTMEWHSTESTFQHILNETLATEDHEKIKPWFPYLKLFFTALAKVKTKKQIVYRGLNKDISQQYSADKTTHSWQFYMCSSSIKDLESEETFGKKGPRTLFTIECNSAKDITRHAFDTSKTQILLLPGRKFKTVSTLDAGEQLHIIQMQELEPLLPLE